MRGDRMMFLQYICEVALAFISPKNISSINMKAVNPNQAITNFLAFNLSINFYLAVADVGTVVSAHISSTCNEKKAANTKSHQREKLMLKAEHLDRAGSWTHLYVV